MIPIPSNHNEHSSNQHDIPKDPSLKCSPNLHNSGRGLKREISNFDIEALKEARSPDGKYKKIYENYQSGKISTLEEAEREFLEVFQTEHIARWIVDDMNKNEEKRKEKKRRGES
ncbi:MAG: hypothetical protein K0S74_1055 [Chlamydiales bacterium]|jgi:hypothetical protein|nr:hypothetical protein [Chlamydiales bacterium]